MEETLSPIISAGAAAIFLNESQVVWVDARGGPDAYQRYCEGHLQGALFVDLEKDLSAKSENAAKGGRHPLPDPGTFAALLTKTGIGPSTHIMVYDDKGGANAAARFWWMMKAAGHSKVQVVDGGYQALVDQKLPVSKVVAAPVPATEPYPAKPWQRSVVDIDTVAKVAQDPDYLVIDVREAYRYSGESEPIDLIAGHIPGAVNIPYTNNLEANGRFRPPQSLAGLYASAIGKHDPKKVVVHCGSGVTACHTLLSMEHAGISDASLYVGSWSEWSRNERPVATGGISV